MKLHARSFRWCGSRTIPLTRSACSSPSRKHTVRCCWETLSRLGIPYTFVGEQPVLATRRGKAAQALCHLLSEDCPRQRLFAFLRLARPPFQDLIGEAVSQRRRYRPVGSPLSGGRHRARRPGMARSTRRPGSALPKRTGETSRTVRAHPPFARQVYDPFSGGCENGSGPAHLGRLAGPLPADVRRLCVRWMSRGVTRNRIKKAQGGRLLI